jgi:chaperonin GroEL
VRSRAASTWFLRALEEPIRQIANNAGAEGSVVVEKVKDQKGRHGYNAETGKYEDLMKGRNHRSHQGHPVCPSECASVAALLLTTEAMIAEKPKEKEDMPAGMGGGPRHGRHGRHGRHDVRRYSEI